jgi:hypothetical protein
LKAKIAQLQAAYEQRQQAMELAHDLAEQEMETQLQTEINALLLNPTTTRTI